MTPNSSWAKIRMNMTTTLMMTMNKQHAVRLLESRMESMKLILELFSTLLLIVKSQMVSSSSFSSSSSTSSLSLILARSLSTFLRNFLAWKEYDELKTLGFLMLQYNNVANKCYQKRILEMNFGHFNNKRKIQYRFHST